MSNWTIIDGDCRDFMRQTDERFQLTVTSPPYDSFRHYENSLEWNEDVWKEVIDGLWRVTKEGGGVVWVVNDQSKGGGRTGTFMRQYLFFMEVGFLLYEPLIWKKFGMPAVPKRHYMQTHEYMFYFSKGRPSTARIEKNRRNKYYGAKVYGEFRGEPDGQKRQRKIYGDGKIDEFGADECIWEIPANPDRSVDHPAAFPIALPRKHIHSWSEPGDLIFDPFSGSGTTGVAAIETGRNYIGCEKVKKFADASRDRLAAVSKRPLTGI